MRLPVILLIATCAAWAGDARFNGRWDISGNHAAWLEITGAETDKPAGRYVSAFDGDMNVIEQISIRKGELEFGWPSRKLQYSARLVAGKLEGMKPSKWVGVRAPRISEKDDGSWHEGRTVTLFDGKNLAGWQAVGGGAPSGWSVDDGTLSGNGRANDIVTVDKFWNFVLHVEFKVAPHSNSGVGLRGRYEVQVLDDYGRPPNTHGNGALYARILPSGNASKPADQWQTFDVRLIGRQVTIALNGKTIIDKREIEGLTAIAVDASEATPGPIYLQGDHGPVQFRNLRLTELTRK
ncbi:MAG TPA: DUF1080 domain-containing protein [Edaphobacter sp.]|nr:DUF1080 domain-containing protein [Edaphobacter sp.]